MGLKITEINWSKNIENIVLSLLRNIYFYVILLFNVLFLGLCLENIIFRKRNIFFSIGIMFIQFGASMVLLYIGRKIPTKKLGDYFFGVFVMGIDFKGLIV